MSFRKVVTTALVASAVGDAGACAIGRDRSSQPRADDPDRRADAPALQPAQDAVRRHPADGEAARSHGPLSDSDDSHHGSRSGAVDIWTALDRGANYRRSAGHPVRRHSATGAGAKRSAREADGQCAPRPRARLRHDRNRRLHRADRGPSGGAVPWISRAHSRGRRGARGRCAESSQAHHEMTAVLDKIAAGELLARRQDMAGNQLLIPCPRTTPRAEQARARHGGRHHQHAAHDVA